jgi:hypothetical protein
MDGVIFIGLIGGGFIFYWIARLIVILKAALDLIQLDLYWFDGWQIVLKWVVLY